MKIRYLLLIIFIFVINTIFIVSLYERNYNKNLEDLFSSRLTQIEVLSERNNRIAAENKARLLELQVKISKLSDRQLELASRLDAIRKTLADDLVVVDDEIGQPLNAEAVRTLDNTEQLEPAERHQSSKRGNYRRIVGSDGKVYYKRED